MNASELEYHCFGPWILEIKEDYPMPPLFVPYYKESNNYLMLIKVPRNTDRAHSLPGMDLYQYVIGMYDNYVYILERNGKTVLETKFLYGEIEGIENFTDLLLGRLTIYLKDRKVKVNYSSVSEDIIINLIKIIRDRYTKKIYKEMPMYNKECENLDTLYINLLHSMKSRGDLMNISAVQPTIKVKATNQSILKKLLYSLNQQKLLSSIHLSNDKELLVLSRGKAFKFRSDTILSYSLTYIPIEKIQTITFVKDETHFNLQKLYININDYEYIFYIDINSKLLQDYYKNLKSIIDLSSNKLEIS